MTATTSEFPAAERVADPADVVRTFLTALQDRELDRALELLDEHVAWINVTLPTIRGRKGVDRVLRPGFEKLPAASACTSTRSPPKATPS